MSVKQANFHRGRAERRSCARTFYGKSGQLFFSRQIGLRACYVRDITELGAGIRLERLPLLPLNFLLSFDQFESVRTCRLTWREGDFVGVAFGT
jgi:hypothetical protein